MLGVDPEEFKSRLDALVDADQAATAAARDRTIALGYFYEWAVGAHHRVVCPKLRDLLLALSQ